MIDKNYFRIFEYIINPAIITVPIITPSPINHSCENNSKFVTITIPIKFAMMITREIIIKFLANYAQILSSTFFFFLANSSSVNIPNSLSLANFSRISRLDVPYCVPSLIRPTMDSKK